MHRIRVCAPGIDASLGHIAGRAEALPLDVVVSGSGFHVLYYLGVQQVLSRLEKAHRLRLNRYAGASSGAQAPWQWLLQGEVPTVECHLALGMLWDRYAANDGALAAGRKLRTIFPIMIAWIFAGSPKLDDIKGRVHVSVTHFSFTGLRNAMYSEFETAAFAQQVFYATGTLLTRVDGRRASDGGLTNNFPTFSDGLRTQLLVRPGRSANPRGLAFKFSYQQAVEAIERGQDDMCAFARTAMANGGAPETLEQAKLKGQPLTLVRAES